MKIIIYLTIAIILAYGVAKLEIYSKKQIIKEALEEHEKEKANDKSRE